MTLDLIENPHGSVVTAIFGIAELADLVGKLQYFEWRSLIRASVCAILGQLCSSRSWVGILAVAVFVALLAIGAGETTIALVVVS